MNSHINIQDYSYVLPPERIALHPLSQRDESKLLVYSHGTITHHRFKDIVNQLPSRSFLFFNDTKVIPARLIFTKETGASIEIFLLSPIKPSSVMADVMNATHSCQWQCTIGNLKRWKDNQTLEKNLQTLRLHATLIDRAEGIVKLTWNTDHTFAEVVTQAGITPLPPYIKRDASEEDVQRYQTIYSHTEGAVAAPTAGLHFTNQVFQDLTKKGISSDFVTLHVSAGTFQPVKAENALEHEMHHEQIVISRKAIENLIQADKTIVAVGTTSMRTLESVYWFGAKLANDKHSTFTITQKDPYEIPAIDPAKALQKVLQYMDENKSDTLTGTTSIYIYPGYTFKICKALITNFHLPGSTLMLLVAAFVGDNWKKIYEEALRNDYRFLSYGDSSLLIP